MRLILGLLAAAVPAIALGQTVASKTPYGTVPTTHDSKYTISPDGQHLAVLKSSGSRRVVSIDGVDGEISAWLGSASGAVMHVFPRKRSSGAWTWGDTLL